MEEARCVSSAILFLWLAAQPARCQATPEDTLEELRARGLEGIREPASFRAELACLLRLDRVLEVPDCARACAAGLAPGELRSALLRLAEDGLDVENTLVTVRTLRRRGALAQTLPLLLAIREQAHADVRVLVGLAEALMTQDSLRDPELARECLNEALGQVASRSEPQVKSIGEFVLPPGMPADRASLTRWVQADLEALERNQALSGRPTTLQHCSFEVARLGAARDRGDQIVLVESAARLESAFGGNPAFTFLIGATRASLGPEYDPRAARADLQRFLAVTDFETLRAHGCELEFQGSELEPILTTLVGKTLDGSRAAARSMLLELSDSRTREPLLVYPSRSALPGLIADLDRKLAELQALAKERTEHHKELTRWRKALAKDLGSPGIGGQSADTIRDHIHKHSEAIARIDKRLAAEKADPVAPRWRARRALATQIMARYDTRR